MCDMNNDIIRGYRYKVKCSVIGNWIVSDSCIKNFFGSNYVVESYKTRKEARENAYLKNIEQPSVCIICKTKGSVTFERFSKRYGEFVCDVCGWAVNVPKTKGMGKNRGQI